MKALAHLPPAEVVAHRVVWSLPVAGRFSSPSGAGPICAARSQHRGCSAWRR
jgi:hypothetical protein